MTVPVLSVKRARRPPQLQAHVLTPWITLAKVKVIVPEIRPFLTGFLSQWHPSRFTLGGRDYVCAEQYMMHHKALLFDDQRAAQAILASNQPADHKRWGRQVRAFRPEVWEVHKVAIVTAANRAKFSQNPGLRKKLLATGDAILVEANPRDQVWGVGLEARAPEIQDPRQWRGENLLGQILMQVRAELAADTHD